MKTTWTTLATDPEYGMWVGQVEVLTHPPEACSGRPCVVHSPSNHHMREWPTVYRADKGMTERTCRHGVGHPDPDDLAYHLAALRPWMGVHGCDGCCHDPRR